MINADDFSECLKAKGATSHVAGDTGGRAGATRAGLEPGPPGPSRKCAMSNRLVSACRVAVFLLLLMDCAKRPPPVRSAVTVHVESDPGAPVRGANVLLDGKRAATTGADGTATLALEGDEGQPFDLTVTCPEELTSPASAITVVLHRLEDDGRTPRYRTLCQPKTRTVVVVVSADHGLNLPVLYLGGEVARTDSAGAANVLLHIAPGERFSLSLDTTGTGGESLRPVNPVATFTVGNRDEVFVFDPHFTVLTKKRRWVPRGPVEIRR